MKAIDTFRTEPYKHNCAQAIAHKWHALYPQGAEIVVAYAPLVGGRAPDGYCGALYAAMQAMPDRADEIKTLFGNAIGATRCRDIKGRGLAPCPLCVDTADKILEQFNTTT